MGDLITISVHLTQSRSHRWNQLKEEYVALCDTVRKQNQSNRAQLSAEAANQDDTCEEYLDVMDEDHESQTFQAPESKSPQFPTNCVLQLTNLDPITNKPTIRSDLLKYVDQSECAYIEYVKALSTVSRVMVLRFVD